MSTANRVFLASQQRLGTSDSTQPGTEETSLDSSLEVSSLILTGLRRVGRVYQALCPFKPENEASFTLFPDDSGGHYHCFSCGAHGSLASIGYSLDDGRLVHASCSEVLPTDSSSLKSHQETFIPKATPEKLEAFTESACVYHSYLLEDSKALDYLKNSRGLLPSTIAKYMLGYANGVSILSSYPHELRQDLRQKFSSAGILTRFGTDYFRGHLVYPDFSLEKPGMVSDLLGRGFPEKSFRKFPSHIVRRSSLYLEKFAIDSLLEGEDILFIAEGANDALTLRQAGFNAVAVNGVHSFSKKDAARLRKYGFKLFVVMLDGDEAGINGSARIVSLLGKKARSLAFPADIKRSDGSFIKDWNELFLEVFSCDIPSFRACLARLIDEVTRCVGYVHIRHLNGNFDQGVKSSQTPISITFPSVLNPGGGTLVFDKNTPQIDIVDGAEKWSLFKIGNKDVYESLPDRIPDSRSWPRKDFLQKLSMRDSWLSSILDKAKAKVLEPLSNWLKVKTGIIIYLSVLFEWGESRGLEELVRKIKSCGSTWVKERHKETSEERYRNIACGARQFCPRDSYYYFNTLYNNTREVILAILDGLIAWGIIVKAGFKAVGYELTLPRYMSEFMDNLAKEDLATWDKMMSDLKACVPKFLKKIDCVPTGFHRFHYLSSSMPWLVHYHFHMLVIPASKKDGVWHRIRRFLDPNDLEQCKIIWAKIIMRWAKKWNIPVEKKLEKLVVHRHYFKNLIKLCFNIKYVLRAPLHDLWKGLKKQKGDKYFYKSKDPDGNKVEKWLTAEELGIIFDRVALYHTSESYSGKKFRNFRLMSWFGALSPNQKKKLLPDFDLVECEEESPWERADDNVYRIRSWNKAKNTVTMQVVYIDLGMDYKYYQDDGEIFEVPAEQLVWDKPRGVVKVKKIWRKNTKADSGSKKQSRA